MTASTPPPTSAQRRIAAIREDISSRIQSITKGMSSGRFNGLVDQMAQLQFKFEQRSAADGRKSS